MCDRGWYMGTLYDPGSVKEGLSNETRNNMYS